MSINKDKDEDDQCIQVQAKTRKYQIKVSFL